MTLEVECGFLTYHPRHADMPNVVRYKGQWMPEALATGMNDKRFTDAELMAEYHKLNARRYQRHYNELSSGDEYPEASWDEHFDIQNTIYRFALAPHFDEVPAT